MKVGIQGLEGSYHHQAAVKFFGDNIEIAPFENFRQLFEALDKGIISKAVSGIENSLYGSINDTYDLLMQYRPNVIGEVYLHVQLNLLALEGSSIDEITDVYSQAPALAESKVYLRENLPTATLHEYPDTAMSARYVAKSKQKNIASIASEMAAKLYNLDIIAEGIEDHKHNYTRFIAISRHDEKIVDQNKTSIIIEAKHEVGSLYNVLGCFAKNKINLSKIESRPIVTDDSWHYMFYIDFEAGINSEAGKKAMTELEDYTDEIILLGSYKRDVLPNGIR